MKCCWKARCDKQYGGIRHFQGFHLCCIVWNGWEMVSLFSQDFVMRHLGHRGWLTVKTGGEYWWLLIASQKQERGNSSSFKIKKQKISRTEVVSVSGENLGREVFFLFVNGYQTWLYVQSQVYQFLKLYRYHYQGPSLAIHASSVASTYCIEK